MIKCVDSCRQVRVQVYEHVGQVPCGATLPRSDCKKIYGGTSVQYQVSPRCRTRTVLVHSCEYGGPLLTNAKNRQVDWSHGWVFGDSATVLYEYSTVTWCLVFSFHCPAIKRYHVDTGGTALRTTIADLRVTSTSTVLVRVHRRGQVQ